MSIDYTKSHYWLKSFTLDTLEPYSKSNREKLKSTIKRYSEYEIEYEVVPMTEEILTWFTPLYNEIISSKSNPVLHDIKSNTMSGKRPYFALIMKQSGVNIGATLFSVKDWYVSIAYRVYPNNWNNEIKLRSNPSLLSDYFLSEYTKSLDIKCISHGLDRNPYGINSHIGLASFKLSIGCRAFIPSIEAEIFSFDENNITTDTLILHRPSEKIRISEATLYVIEENIDKYSHVTKYPDLLKVNIVPIKKV